MGLVALVANAADVAGQWRAEFDTQLGQQRYGFTFQTDGDKLTGKAVAELDGQKRDVDVELKEGKTRGDTVSFVEIREFEGNQFRSQYTGKVGADGIKFTREVGDFGRTESKATRAESAVRGAAPQRRDGGFNRPIVLGPDDKAAFDEPPAGFNVRRDSIPHGKLEMIEYDSKTVGTKRRMQVYPPPGYTKDKKYPVLYLLHGLGGDENTFAWLGGFSSAPNTKPPAELVPDPAATKAQLKLLMLSCGNKDGLIGISQGMHTYLKEKEVTHIWHVDGNAHDATHWRNSLYHRVQIVFR